MPAPPRDHPYRRNSQNLAAIEKGLTQAERAHKYAIRSGQEAAIQFQARIHMFVVGMMAEARLRKILSDPAGFNDRERKLVMRYTSQIERWQAAVEYAFRRHYNVPIHLDVDSESLDSTKAGQFEQLCALLRDDLEPIIQDRNKTAHAQWVWHLNHGETAFTGAAPAPLNYLQIASRARIIRRLSELIYALAVSEPTFQRDFDAAYTALVVTKKESDGADYPEWVAALRPARPPSPLGSHRRVRSADQTERRQAARPDTNDGLMSGFESSPGGLWSRLVQHVAKVLRTNVPRTPPPT